jgi:hypothetical protein
MCFVASSLVDLYEMFIIGGLQIPIEKMSVYAQLWEPIAFGMHNINLFHGVTRII